MDRCQRFRKLLKEKDFMVTPGVGNPLHARIVEQVGFDWVYMSGYSTNLSILGTPDVGLMTETEMVTNARNIARCVKVPVIADADTGFGNAVNVIRTVEDYESAGVAGIHLEDQVNPKRCGHLAGKMIIPIEEAIGKIKAAIAARKNKDFVIIARTDAIAAVGGGLEEALRRGKAYAQAGADVVFCEFSSPDPREPKRFAEGMHREFPGLPLFFNYSSSFRWVGSTLTFTNIGDMGYKLIIVSLGCLRASLKAVWDYVADLKDRGEGAEKDFQKNLRRHPTEDFNAFAGFPRIKEIEAEFLPSEEVKRKYEKSKGLHGR